MTLGLIVYLLQARRLAHVGAAPRPRRGAAWVTSLLVIAGTLGILALTAAVGRSALPMAARAVPAAYRVAAIVWFAMSGDIDGQRIAAVFVFFIAAMVFWAIFEQAGITIALFADRAHARGAVRLVVPVRLVSVAEFAVRDPARAPVRLAVAAAGQRASRRAR